MAPFFSLIKNSKMYEYEYFSFHKFSCWKQDVSSFTIKSILSVCALGDSHFQVDKI